MSNQSLFEQLELNNEKNLLIQGLPSSLEKMFIKLSYAKNVTPLLKNKKVDFALVFAVNQAQLANLMKEVFTVLSDKTKLWVSFPKSTSKIVSDLNRPGAWDLLTNKDYEGVSLITLDHMWVAMRFVKSSLKSTLIDESATNSNVVAEEVEEEGDDNNYPLLVEEEAVVATPDELKKVFTKHKKVQEFYTSLSTTHQKEYVSWIEGAKKIETRQRRLEVVVEKLMAGKRTPTER